MHLRVLPGVRRHVHQVQRHLTSGRSCIWVLPAAMTNPQRIRQLLDLIEEAVPIVEVEAPAALPTPPAPSPAAMQGKAVLGTIEEMLRAAFDVDHEPSAPDPRPGRGITTLAHRVMQAVHRYFPHLPDSPADDPLAALASLPVPSPVVVVVHADDEHDADEVTALIRQYPALVRERPVHDSDRAVLLVIGTVAKLRDVERADPLITGVHWWWGVLSRLDLLTVATLEATVNGGWHRELLDDLCSDLLPEVIAEVAGPDIDLAADLARNWDGTYDDLVNRVAAAADDAESNDTGHAGYGHRDPASSAPSQRLWDQWTAGHVDAWGGRTRPSLRAVPKDDLGQALTERLWVGQARALNPVLDEIRHNLLDAVRDSSPASTMANLNRFYCNGAGVDTIELNDLRRAIRDGPITIDSRQRDLLDHAVGARNQLAHREFVHDSRLRAISQLSHNHRRS